MNSRPAPSRPVAVLAVGLALVVSSCGGGQSDEEVADTTIANTAAPTAPAVTAIGTDTADDAGNADDAAPVGGDTITIADFAFTGVTEIPVGTTVVVTNSDPTPHTFTAEDGTFDSGSLAAGETFEFTFDTPGEFAYFCNFHPSMTGTITVTG